MLILPDADRLRIDLHQFGQRVLQPPRDRDRAAQGDIEFGQFLGGKGGGRIDRRAGLGNHDLRHLQIGQPFYQLHRKLVGLARRGAVADRDQIDAVRYGEFSQCCQRLVPALLRLVRIHRCRRHHLAGGVDHGDLDAGAEAGIEAHGDARAGGRRQQEVTQVRREYAHRFGLGGVPQPHPQIDVEMDLDVGAPGPAHRLHHPFVAGPALIGQGKALHDLQLIGADRVRRGGDRFRQHLQIEDLFLFAAKHRENAVRRQFCQRLAVIEIIPEFFAFGFLALAHPGGQQAAGPHLLAQRAEQVGVLRKAFNQNGASAVERGGRIAHLLVGIDEGFGQHERLALGLGQQQVGERLQPRLFGDLGLGAALRLERQIDVLQARLAVGGEDGRFECCIELALLADRIRKSRCGALRARAGSSAALPDCAIAYRRVRQ